LGRYEQYQYDTYNRQYCYSFKAHVTRLVMYWVEYTIK
jgi:hypothetical protein